MCCPSQTPGFSFPFISTRFAAFANFFNNNNASKYVVRQTQGVQSRVQRSNHHLCCCCEVDSYPHAALARGDCCLLFTVLAWMRRAERSKSSSDRITHSSRYLIWPEAPALLLPLLPSPSAQQAHRPLQWRHTSRLPVISPAEPRHAKNQTKSAAARCGSNFRQPVALSPLSLLAPPCTRISRFLLHTAATDTYPP